MEVSIDPDLDETVELEEDTQCRDEHEFGLPSLTAVLTGPADDASPLLDLFDAGLLVLQPHGGHHQFLIAFLDLLEDVLFYQMVDRHVVVQELFTEGA